MEKEIKLIIDEDGVAHKYEEPYVTIECKTKEDFDILLNLLERDNAKKVQSHNLCPNGCVLGEEDKDKNFCGNCGQKLDWS